MIAYIGLWKKITNSLKAPGFASEIFHFTSHVNRRNILKFISGVAGVFSARCGLNITDNKFCCFYAVRKMQIVL